MSPVVQLVAFDLPERGRTAVDVLDYVVVGLMAGVYDWQELLFGEGHLEVGEGAAFWLLLWGLWLNQGVTVVGCQWFEFRFAHKERSYNPKFIMYGLDLQQHLRSPFLHPKHINSFLFGLICFFQILINYDLSDWCVVEFRTNEL